MRHATTLDEPQQKPFAALEESSLRTEESGQDCMCCGLHLKQTAPEKTLMMEGERRWRDSDGFLLQLDLKESERLRTNTDRH